MLWFYIYLLNSQKGLALWGRPSSLPSGNQPTSGWNSFKHIVAMKRPTGPTVAGAVMTLDITDVDLKTTANGGKVEKSDGSDIRFEDLTGNKLPHDLELYDGTAGRIVAHIRLPSWTMNQHLGIRMLFGNASATDQRDTTGTWNGWLVAYRPAAATDLTGNGRNLTLQDVGTVQLLNRTAADFNGSTSKAYVNNADAFMAGLTELTVFTTFRIDNAPVDQKIIVDYGVYSPRDFGMVVVTENPGFESGTPEVIGTALKVPNIVKLETSQGNDANPHVLSTLWKSGEVIDGTIDNNDLHSWSGDDTNTGVAVSGSLKSITGAQLMIGAGDTTYAFDGRILEVFIDNKKRNKEEMKFMTDCRLYPNEAYAVGRTEAASNQAYAPVARNFDLTTQKDTQITREVVSWAWSPHGNAVSLESVTQPTNGTSSVSGNNVVYVPNSGFIGTDSFTYTVRDTNNGLTHTATVNVTVEGGQQSQGNYPPEWPQPRSGNTFHLANAHAGNNSVSQWESWMGNQVDMRTAFGPKPLTWDDVAGGAGIDPTTIGGQLNASVKNEIWNANYWPTNLPVCELLWLVPQESQNKKIDGSWSNPNIWQDIVNGIYDSKYSLLAKRHANRTASNGRDPRLVAIEFEPEHTGDWMYGSIGPDVSNFILAWRRIVDIFRQEYEAIHGQGKYPYFVWRPSPAIRFGQNASNYSGPERLWTAFPGSSHVDIIGLSIHDKTGISSTSDWNIYLYYPSIGQLGYPKQEGFYDFFDWAVQNTPCWLCTPEYGINTTDSPPNFPLTQNPTAAFNGMWELVKRYRSRWAFMAYLSSGKHALHWTSAQRSMGQRFKEIWGANGLDQQ